MGNFSSKSYCFNRTFQDFDELTETARAWDLEFSQLDRGHFDGELAQIGNERLNLSYARFARHLLQKGAPPQGFRTFVIPADSEQRFLWRRKEITGAHVPVFPKGGELDAVSWSGFQVFTLSFSEEMFLDTGLTLVTTMGSVLDNVELSQEHVRTDGEILHRGVVSGLFGKTAVAGGLRLLEMRQ